MPKKRYKAAKEKVDSAKKHSVDEAFRLVVETSNAKFDESVDVCVNLGVDPKQSDQQVKGAVPLPHGLGKKVRILVFAKGAQEEEAKKAGADYAGSDEYAEKIKKGWMEFDKILATPDMMPTLSKIARILGPKGLMPNPKLGTVTPNVAQAVNLEKKGRLSYKVEKAGIVHAVVGKKSMGQEKLKENYLAFMGALLRNKPSSSKGTYLRGISISGSMGPGIRVDAANTQSLL